MNRRVVITGMGAITPVGKSTDSFWNSIKEGKCGIDFIKAFDASDFKVKLAAEVKDFNPEDYVDRREANRMDRFSQFAIAASEEAVKDSKLDIDSLDKNRFGVIVGSGIGGIGTIEKQNEKLLAKGPNRVSPITIPMIIANMAAGNLAIKYGAKGICTTIVTACASSNNAIGEAFRNIKFGYTDVMITGGSEAGVTPLSLAGFASMKAVTKSEDPNRASIPFDKDRSGFVMGEVQEYLFLRNWNTRLKEEQIYMLK